MNVYNRRIFSALVALLASGCGGSSSSSSTIPSQPGTARVRFADGAPSLETLIGGVPQQLCPGPSTPCYLQMNNQTVTQNFYYGSMTSFVNVTAGALSLVARVEAGYAVGPLQTTALTAGKSYTLVVVGSYPKYQVLAFEEPASSGSASLSLYNAAPSKLQESFGTFRASTHSDFKQRGSARFGTVTTVSLGTRVTDIGGYAGSAGSPVGTVTPSQIDVFDRHNALPYHNIARLSLFLYDTKCPSGSCAGPLFGSLDR
ncbi:MAG: DUF4397 domain-containing protein [Candidatus Eremiobacteraeota bacterium]|nr:DUF4397 domain-containing protein [Candidatus Eremiobacteraeota bacterium]